MDPEWCFPDPNFQVIPDLVPSSRSESKSELETKPNKSIKIPIFNFKWLTVGLQYFFLSACLLADKVYVKNIALSNKALNVGTWIR